VNATVAVLESVKSAECVKRDEEGVKTTGKTWVYRDEAVRPAEPESDDEKASSGVMSLVWGADGRQRMAAWKEGTVSPDVNKFKPVKTVDKKKRSVARKRRTDDKERKSVASLEEVLAVKERAARKLVRFIEEKIGTAEESSPVVNAVEPVRAAESVAVQEEEAVVEGVPELEESVVVVDQEETVESPAKESEPIGTEEPSPVKRLFSGAELDAMAECESGREVTVMTGVEVAVEEEGYEKELEDRLYPLDEVELLKRAKKIAEAKKEPSIEEMAGYLGLPVDVLERTKGASRIAMTSPEYWQEWFEKTLQSLTEAKRANRDFRNTPTDPVTMVNDTSSVIVEDFGLPREGIGTTVKDEETREEDCDLKIEEVVYVNIGVPLKKNEDPEEDATVMTTTNGEELP
jgi:hypothetical protein